MEPDPLSPSPPVDDDVAWQVERYADPAAFTRAAADFLAAQPVLSTVVSSATAAWAGAVRPASDEGFAPWWVTVREPGGPVVSVVMRTASFAPHPLYVLPMPRGAALAVAARLVERGDDASSANGAAPATAWLLAELARLRGEARVPEVAVPIRLFELDALVPPPRPPGLPRRADEGDLGWLVPVLGRFETEAARQAGRTVRDAGDHLDEHWVRRRLGDEGLWVWEDHGEPVCVVGATPTAYGVSRVGPVLTPEEHRGRGYAAALTAHVSALRRDEGARVCLFTDAGNPVSNALYARLGFRPLTDMAEVVLRRRPPGERPGEARGCAVE
ncbi:GNAT family N-acetyltransferase [Nocardioides sp. GY 10127]|uniref:GNAT family N-acetyltransferase n=1 Tax=Nocardioides sp. GY 10127 TaxID=2569762 RepID=UPI0010A88145|nr:GNAT family N-acetyltransferase [Nocardioides sp. GY 10127]TIC80743.1 GNAT family N-acetyltransferase [Nocardioides sp. GY 10127]